MNRKERILLARYIHRILIGSKLINRFSDILGKPETCPHLNFRNCDWN